MSSPTSGKDTLSSFDEDDEFEGLLVDFSRMASKFITMDCFRSDIFDWQPSKSWSGWFPSSIFHPFRYESDLGKVGPWSHTRTEHWTVKLKCTSSWAVTLVYWLFISISCVVMYSLNSISRTKLKDNLWSDYTGLLGQASCSVRLSSTCATRLSFSESGWIFCSIHSVVLALSATKNIFTFSHKISTTISWFSPIKCGSTFLAWMLSSLTADGRYMEDFMISFTRQGEEKWCLRFRWTRRYCII